MRRFGVCCVVVAGCGFTNTVGLGDGSDGGGGEGVPAGPTITFSIDMQTVSETPGGMNATATIVLSEPASRSFNLSFNVMGSAQAADFMLVTSPPLTIDQGATMATITVRINDDALDEGSESVQLALQQPSFGVLGSPSTHTIHIADDDASCYGTGAFATCFANPPTGMVTLPSTINTDAAPCANMQPIGWTGAQNQPDACFITGASITAAVPVSVTGSRPLVLVASGTITVSALIDVSSHRMPAATGPGAPSSACTTPMDLGGADSSGGGGGAGGSYFSKGGDGGNGKSGSPGGLAAAAETMLPTRLRAGCNGQRGQTGDAAAGTAGRGGGAIYLVAGTSITVAAAGGINASGSGANGGGDSSGGSGGGSGGTIKLHAPAMMFTAGSRLVANGGGGSSSGNDDVTGVFGADPDVLMPATSATGGNGPANGGAGFAGATDANRGQNANPASANAGGGGGGGGGGLIESNQPLTNAIVSAGRVVP